MCYILFFIIIIITILSIIYHMKYKYQNKDKNKDKIKESFIDFVYPIKKRKINLFYSDCIIPEGDITFDDKPYYEKSNQDLTNMIFKNKPIYNTYKKYNDKYYGIANTTNQTIDYYQQIIDDSIEMEESNNQNKFIQGNICQLSKWSNWSDCNKKCGDKDYNTQYRTRTILNQPENCYSPTNPILKQKVTCGYIPCFTQFTY